MARHRITLACGCSMPVNRDTARVVCRHGVSQAVDRQAIAVEQVPTWISAISRLRKDTDIGVGDTVQRVAKWLGGELFKALSMKLGIPCRCAERQDEWNRMYPYLKEYNNQDKHHNP